MLSGKLNDLRNIYDKNTVLTDRSFDIQTGKQKSFVELEAKFGHYNNRGFSSTVPYVHYERLLDLLRNHYGKNEFTQESHVAQFDTIRRITIVSQGEGPEVVIWQRKIKLQDFDFAEYDVRVSMSREDNISADEIPKTFNPTVIRERTRHTFTLVENIIKIDLTEVMMRAEDMIVRQSYEVELEFAGNKDSLQVFVDYVDNIFKWLRGTNIIYTNTDKNLLIGDVTRILGGTNTYKIDKRVLVEARNIKRRDIVYGGIVGNSSIKDPNVLSNGKSGGTNYAITYKADGLRKMLIIHTTGIWLVYPPFEFNLVLTPTADIFQRNTFLNNFSGTILDGELGVARVQKDISYWYLGFDCLSFKGNTGIQSLSYLERHKFVDAIAGKLKTKILTVDTKIIKEIKTPGDFFRLVGEFLDKRNDLEYKEDGLMFIPIDVIYNPRSQKHPLNVRVLTSIPDTCKWKEGGDITIDFSIRWLQDGRLDLYSYDDVTENMVPFRGDLINPLTADMIDYLNPLTLNKPTNLIVEYEWIKSVSDKGT
jgi:hypothetical protein